MAHVAELHGEAWLPWAVRVSTHGTLNLFQLTCLIHRIDPEHLTQVLWGKWSAECAADEQRASLNTPVVWAQMLNAAPQLILGDDMGKTLMLLQKAIGAPTFQVSMPASAARTLTLALRLNWPAELDVGAVDHGASTPNAGAAPLIAQPPPWALRVPKRFQGYRLPLFRLLERALAEGRAAPPTAREVLEQWRQERPAEVVRVLSDGFDYLNASGVEKTADLAAIRKAIADLVEK